MYPLAKIWFMTEAGYDYDKKNNKPMSRRKKADSGLFA